MNQVAEKKSAGLPTNMFEDDAAKGLGAIGQEDLALPFLKILGQLSPEVNKRDGKYVEGAEPGMIFNSVSGELYDGVKGIDVIPAFYKLEYIEWKDRGDGPGATGTVSAAQSNFITSGQITPSNSVAANWYQSLGSSSASGNASAFNLASEYAAAKTKVKQTLGTPSAVGMLAVNDSPFFDFLQKHNLTKGIL